MFGRNESCYDSRTVMTLANLRPMSIGLKLIGGFILVIVPIVAISLWTATLALQVTRREVSQSYRSSLATAAGHLGNTLQRLEDMVDALASDDSVQVINQAPDTGATILEYRGLLDRLGFYSLTNGLENVLTVHLFGKGRAFTSRAGFETLVSRDREDLTEALVRAGGRWVLRESGAGLNSAHLSYGKYVPSPSGRLDLAVTVGVRQEAVLRFLDTSDIEEGLGVILVDAFGEVVFSSADLQRDLVVAFRSEPPFDQNPAGVSVSAEGERYRLLAVGIDDTGLVLGLFLPEGRYTAPIRAIRRWLFIVASCALVLGSGFAFYERRNILRPIRRLTTAMGSVQGGPLEHYVEVDRGDEIGVLCRQFNAMVRRIRSLLDEVNLEHLKYEQVQFRLLQSQVNPHFLYNTLNLIYRMSMAKDSEGAARLSLNLAKYYRLVTRSEIDMVTLEEEMENARTYIEIHEARHPSRLQHIVSWAPELGDCRIPRLIVQPLVENAILHGLDSLEQEGSVTVRANRVDGAICVEVEDSGKGMTAEQLRSTLELMHDPASDAGGIGLSNCYWRLRLKYGDSSDVVLKPRMPSGLQVTLLIPEGDE